MSGHHVAPSELAKLLGVEESTVRKWCEQGMMQARKERGEWMIQLPCNPEDIKRFKALTNRLAAKYGGEIEDYERQEMPLETVREVTRRDFRLVREVELQEPWWKKHLATDHKLAVISGGRCVAIIVSPELWEGIERLEQYATALEDRIAQLEAAGNDVLHSGREGREVDDTKRIVYEMTAAMVRFVGEVRRKAEKDQQVDFQDVTAVPRGTPYGELMQALVSLVETVVHPLEQKIAAQEQRIQALERRLGGTHQLY